MLNNRNTHALTLTHSHSELNSFIWKLKINLFSFKFSFESVCWRQCEFNQTRHFLFYRVAPSFRQAFNKTADQLRIWAEILKKPRIGAFRVQLVFTIAAKSIGPTAIQFIIAGFINLGCHCQHARPAAIYKFLYLIENSIDFFCRNCTASKTPCTKHRHIACITEWRLAAPHADLTDVYCLPPNTSDDHFVFFTTSSLPFS